jgi:hypothetical protein
VLEFAQMSNTGKELENLVKTVEKILLPQGFKVSLREKIFEDEIQIAELDITVSGRVGTTLFTWLIECRDRPSEGPAPVSWIEQLVGRRARLNFNKVTAVSTTGFGQPAIDYSRKEGIELRNVADVDISEESISKWFKVRTMLFSNSHGALKHVSFVLPPQVNSEQLSNFNLLLQRINTTDLILIHTGSGEKLSISDAFRDVMTKVPQIFTGIKPGDPPKNRKLEINYPYHQSKYKVNIEGIDIDILKILFDADFSIIDSEIPISQISEYTNILEGNTIAQSIRFADASITDGLDLTLHKIEDASGSVIAITASHIPGEKKAV